MSLVVGPGGNHSRVQRSWAGSLRMASNFRKTPVSSRWCPSPNSPAPGCTMKSPRVPQSLRHRLPEYSHPRRLQRRARQKNRKLQPLLYNNSSDTLSILSPFQGLPRRTSHVRLIAAWRGGWSRHGYLSLTGRETEAQELTVSAWQGKDEDPAPRLTLLGSPPQSGEGGDRKEG